MYHTKARSYLGMPYPLNPNPTKSISSCSVQRRILRAMYRWSSDTYQKRHGQPTQPPILHSATVVGFAANFRIPESHVKVFAPPLVQKHPDIRNRTTIAIRRPVYPWLGRHIWHSFDDPVWYRHYVEMLIRYRPPPGMLDHTFEADSLACNHVDEVALESAIRAASVQECGIGVL